jgi:hypothetical protein
MFKLDVGFNVPTRTLLLLGSLILLPAWARADDFGFAGDSSCTDPPITTEIFYFSTNVHGGACQGFTNHTTMHFDSLTLTAAFPDRNPTSPAPDTFFCSPGPFLSCDFVVDGMEHDSGTTITSGHTISIVLSGDADHGIAVDRGCSLIASCADTFWFNLNNPDSAGLQPKDGNGAGDWLAGGLPEQFTVAANGAVVPEPSYGVILLAMLGTLLARFRMAKKRRELLSAKTP